MQSIIVTKGKVGGQLIVRIVFEDGCEGTPNLELPLKAFRQLMEMDILHVSEVAELVRRWHT